MIKACLNGGRSVADHPKVPVSCADLARAAADAVAVGARAVHLHPRGADGRESLDVADVVAAVTAVREACPGIPVGVSTRDGIVGTAAEKHRLVRAWPGAQRGGPDMASVNWHEAGARELAEVLSDKGIGIEPGLWTPAAARACVADGWLGRAVRVLVEAIPGHSAPNSVEGAASIVAALPPGIPLLVHGEDELAWPVLRWAQARGFDTRIGLEDTVLGEDGHPARDSAALVAQALRQGPAIQSDL